MARDTLESVQSLVVKVGSGVLVRDGTQLDRGTFCRLVEQVAELVRSGRKVALVSSGAVALGRERTSEARPDRERSLPLLQALAAVGQTALMQLYDTEFAHYQLRCGQVLVTRDDLDNRTRYLNARRTMRTLQDMGAVPIINENDTVAHDEIRFGDNDRLAARVATLLEADLLVIFSDVDALYTADPRTDPNAQPVDVVDVDDAALDGMVSGTDQTSGVGTGGMLTKLEAARIAGKRGIPTVILHGKKPATLPRALSGEPQGTLLLPSNQRHTSRKAWIGNLRVHGKLVCDAGAVGAVKKRGRSLLPSGVTEVRGRFLEGDAVELCGPDGTAFARGLVLYPSVDAQRIVGQQSTDIEELLGYHVSDVLVHRDDLVLLDEDNGSAER